MGERGVLGTALSVPHALEEKWISCCNALAYLSSGTKVLMKGSIVHTLVM